MTNNTTPQTYIRRKSYGDKSWGAKSFEDFELNNRTARLEVSTYKNDRGQLVTLASIGFVKGEIVTFTVFSDWSRRLESRVARCTDKAVSEQQARAVAQWGQLKQEVVEFYAQRQAA